MLMLLPCKQENLASAKCVVPHTLRHPNTDGSRSCIAAWRPTDRTDRQTNRQVSPHLLSAYLNFRFNNIYRTIILPVVLYGCETSSLTLREEHRLRVFENRVLRRIFGPERDGVTGEWRKLHEELNYLYCSPNIVREIKSRRMRRAGHVARMEEGRDVHKVLVGKPEGKRPLGRPRRRLEDNIKMDLQEMEGVVGTGWSWL